MGKIVKILSVICLLSLYSMSVLAEENIEIIECNLEMVETEEVDELTEQDFPSPYTRYMMGVSTTITEKDDGRILMGVQVYCSDIMQEITTVFYLQQAISGSWVNVGSYTVTSEDVTHHVKAVYVSNAPSGNYRVKTVNRVRDYNGFAESVTGFSPDMIYVNPDL